MENDSRPVQCSMHVKHGRSLQPQEKKPRKAVSINLNRENKKPSCRYRIADSNSTASQQTI